MDSTSLPCSDDDEWLDSPPLCGDGNHEGGVLVMFALNGYLWKPIMIICKFNDL